MITRTDIINYLIWKRGYRSYLEIGLDDPELNFTRVQCEKKNRSIFTILRATSVRHGRRQT